MDESIKSKFDKLQITEEYCDLESMLDKEVEHIDEMLDNYEIVEDFIDSFISSELDDIFEEFISDIVSKEEYLAEKDEILRVSNINSPSLIAEEANIQLLLEGAEGYDCGEWVRAVFPKVGWLGKWIGAGLGALGLGLGALIVAGKDRLAMAKLKKYMNRLVELTDQGVHKKKPWYSFFTWGELKRNLGEFNTGCFRTIQEAADRNMCVVVMVAAHKLGYFNKGSMMSIGSGDGPQPGGGLSAFDVNIVSQIKLIIENS